MPIEKGQTAPGFALYSSEKNKISLEGQKGKNVLLLFFPLAFTSVCTKEMCAVRDSLSFYNSANAEVFGISVDTPQTLAKFKELENLNFTLLSDFNKEASAAYDVLIEHFSLDMRGVSKRAAFVIDKEGIVQYAEVCPTPGDMPDFNAIQNALSSLN
jgi:glutaredoxin-dependent peroxiredoxin